MCWRSCHELDSAAVAALERACRDHLAVPEELDAEAIDDGHEAFGVRRIAGEAPRKTFADFTTLGSVHHQGAVAQSELEKLVFAHVYAEHRVPTHAQDKRVGLDPREVNETTQLQWGPADNPPGTADDGGSTKPLREPSRSDCSLTTELQLRVRPHGAHRKRRAIPVQISVSRGVEAIVVQISVTPDDEGKAVQISVSQRA